MDAKYILTLSFLLYPLLGLILGYLTRNNPIIRRSILIPIFLIGSLAIVAGVLGVSTIYTSIDFILYASLYLSLSLGLWYIFFKKSKFLAAFCMLILYSLGYIFSLALPLTNDLLPKVTLRLDDDLIYKEVALPSEYAGKQVELFKVHYNFFEKIFFEKAYFDTAPAFVNDTLKIEYIPEERKIYLSIPEDEEKHIYTFHKEFDVNWKDTLNID